MHKRQRLKHSLCGRNSTVHRAEGEDVKQFVNRYNLAYNRIQKRNITIPESTRALILVQKAGVPEEMEHQIIHKVNFSKTECYEDTRSLTKIMGDSKKVVKIDGEDTLFAERVEERVSEVSAAVKSDKNLTSKKSQSGRVGS